MAIAAETTEHRRISTAWIHSPVFDTAFIFGPSAFVTLIVLLFGKTLLQPETFPIWLWALLVLGIDVAHVYSTLFRTYFDKKEFGQRRLLYICSPIAIWAVGVALYSFSDKAFWTVLAYFAIYHFVRQQYGFMMLYRRGEPKTTWELKIDQCAIYLATIYPLIYWHTHPKSFSWLEQGTMVRLQIGWVEPAARLLTIAIFAAFAAKELAYFVKEKRLNIGKSALLFLTALSWYVGIVLYDGDLIFSLINIVSHGVPYIALVWIYQRKKIRKSAQPAMTIRSFFQPKYIPAYILILVSLAYGEEWIWDNLVWREHFQIFGQALYNMATSPLVLTLLVPLLATPQATHYFLDAFIWRVNKSPEVRNVLKEA